MEPRLHGHRASVWAALLADPVRAYRAEWRMRSERDEALPVALALTHDPRPAARARICRFLRDQIERTPEGRCRLRPDVRDALETLLQDPDELVRVSAGTALAGWAVPDGQRPFWRCLWSALASKRLDVRFRAAVGLRGCDQDEVLPAYLEALSGGDVDLRREAAAILGIEESCWARDVDVRESRADVVVPALVRALDDPDPVVVRNAALWGIAPIGEGAASALPRLRAMLASTIPATREAATWAIGALGSAAEPAVDDLRDMLTDPDHEIREVARQVLDELDQAGA
jgi:HEAT repeats